MGIDRPDDADVPSDNSADRTPAAANDGQRSAVSHVETRYREEYYSARTQVAQEERATTGAQQETPAPDTWTETANLAHWMWGEYHRRWPPEERPPVDRSTDPPGSWRSDSNRYLDSSTNARIEAECDRIVEREREKIIASDARDRRAKIQHRHLSASSTASKVATASKRKSTETINEYNRSPREAVSLVPDAIRYTFQYEEARYTQGVRADIARLKEQGFKLDILKNSWSMISTKESTVSGSSPILASGLKCNFIRASASKQSSSRTVPTNGCVPGRPMSSRKWCWKPSRRRLPVRFRFRPALPTFPTTQREMQMPDKVTYYAVVDDLSSRERPAGVFRRIYTEDGGKRDEAFTRNLDLGA